MLILALRLTGRTTPLWTNPTRGPSDRDIGAGPSFTNVAPLKSASDPTAGVILSHLQSFRPHVGCTRHGIYAV
jgi:hypothetical protein